jgi:BASS family bile acid:Na+ symporter
VPPGFGLAVRRWRPALASRLQKPADLLSKALNLLAIGLILVTQFQTLASIRPAVLAGMLALLVVSLAAGWLLGGAADASRRSLTITTGLRNVGLGLVIATGAFAGTQAVTATLAYGLFAVIGSLLVALCWSRRSAGPVNSDGQPAPDGVVAIRSHGQTLRARIPLDGEGGEP